MFFNVEPKMYFDITTYKKALENLSTYKIDNGFWGLLFIIRQVGKENGSVEPYFPLRFSSSEVSKELNKVFSFSDFETTTSNDTVIISEQFVELVKERFLSSPIDLLSSAIVCMCMSPINSDDKTEIITEFKNQFFISDDMARQWFVHDEDSTAVSLVLNPIEKSDVETAMESLPSLSALSFDGSTSTARFYQENLRVQKKRAGDWGASGYLQKYKPTTSAGEIVSVIHSDLLANYIQRHTPKVHSPKALKAGQNKIYYGAPGTGKSYSLSKNLPEDQLIRTVFHPETQYSDFVGCLKPVMVNGTVTYQFRPGPFTLALIRAVNDPLNNYHLIIEEINRAAAAAVFGEIFQLLDRETDGSSTYTIDVSDLDLIGYIQNNTTNLVQNEALINLFNKGKIKLPSNLSLFATMNSSDQAVMPMDTAFKRRWEFEYLQIDYSNASSGNLDLRLTGNSKTEVHKVSWASFAKAINTILINEGVPEDRLLGHRFISENELENNPEQALKGKILMYLWDDVLRHGQHNVIFRDSVTLDDVTIPLTNFGQLVSVYYRAPIFNDLVEQALYESIIDSEPDSVDVVDVN